MAAVEVRGMRKAYGRIEAVRGIDLSIARGQVFALLGPNGAGKTTVVEILAGFLRRDAGEVAVLGLDPGRGGTRLRARIGIVAQQTALDRYLRVEEMLALWTRYYPRRRPVTELLALAGLEDKAAARVTDLSGGQQRRLDLALALAGHPELLFLDEPTTGFDPSARRDAWQLIRSLAGRGTTILLTTHYIEEAQELADEVAVLNRGEIIALGPPATLTARDRTVIRFRLTDPAVGAPSAAPGVRPVPGEAGAWELRTARPAADLHALTGWALNHGTELAALTVSVPTLEDVYLQLTETDDSAGAEGGSVAREPGAPQS
jgi:ABC-2 type transport system ATP-binding protein